MNSTNEAEMVRRALQYYADKLEVSLDQLAETAGISAGRLRQFQIGAIGALDGSEIARLHPLVKDMADAEIRTATDWERNGRRGRRPSLVTDVI